MYSIKEYATVGIFQALAVADNPIVTRRRFNVHKTSIRRRRRRIDVL